MPVTPSEYEPFLHPGDVVTVGIDLPDKTFAEDLATVVAGIPGEIMLRLCGNGFPNHLAITCGANVFISKGEGTTHFHCSARLKEPPTDSFIRIELPDKVTVRERREYTRADVRIPVSYYLPEKQDMGEVIARWESMQGCREACAAEAATMKRSIDSRVNLSGSGLRFKINDCLSYGTLLHLNIVLPGESPEHIHAVGSIIRTKELIPEIAHLEYYSTSMSFRLIESSDRLKLMRFILEEQHKSHAAPVGPLSRKTIPSRAGLLTTR